MQYAPTHSIIAHRGAPCATLLSDVIRWWAYAIRPYATTGDVAIMVGGSRTAPTHRFVRCPRCPALATTLTPDS